MIEISLAERCRNARWGALQNACNAEVIRLRCLALPCDKTRRVILRTESIIASSKLEWSTLYVLAASNFNARYLRRVWEIFNA